jgi:hypothetical protein
VGIYRGKAIDDESVKKKVNFQDIIVYIDRPKGYKQTGTDAKGKPWERVYKFDYGFIPKTLGGDDDGLDVFVGPDSKAGDAFWVRQNKEDGTFDEYKIFVGFPNRDAAMAAYRDHIPLKFFNGMTVMRIDMMKAMLGVKPDGGIKLAMFAGFTHELEYG